jgi:hypothetical protein
MGPATHLAVGLTGKLARQVVVGFVALALVGVTVGECQCLTRVAAADPCACCGSASGPSTGTTLRASTSTDRCGAAGGGTTFGESLTKLDSAPPPGAVINVAALHDDAVSLPMARLVEAPPLVRSSRHPILRI